jgi:hypothetical protein
MHPLAPFAFAALTLIQSAPTELRELTGFHRYKFGMSVEEIQRFTTLTGPEQTPIDKAFGYTTYIGAQILVINRVSYKVNLIFQSGKLQKISIVSLMTEQSDSACTKLFNDSVSDLVKLYGPMDKPPVVDTKTSVTTTDAWFKMRDNARVEIVSTARHSTRECQIQVDYVQGFIDASEETTF